MARVVKATREMLLKDGIKGHLVGYYAIDRYANYRSSIDTNAYFYTTRKAAERHNVTTPIVTTHSYTVAGITDLSSVAYTLGALPDWFIDER